jgi:hypothetical protein
VLTVPADRLAQRHPVCDDMHRYASANGLKKCRPDFIFRICSSNIW